jgi:hypothetical protein
MDHKNKYHKYKLKYYNLLNQIGGLESKTYDIPTDIQTDILTRPKFGIGSKFASGSKFGFGSKILEQVGKINTNDKKQKNTDSDKINTGNNFNIIDYIDEKMKSVDNSFDKYDINGYLDEKMKSGEKIDISSYLDEKMKIGIDINKGIDEIIKKLNTSYNNKKIEIQDFLLSLEEYQLNMIFNLEEDKINILFTLPFEEIKDLLKMNGNILFNILETNIEDIIIKNAEYNPLILLFVPDYMLTSKIREAVKSRDV